MAAALAFGLFAGGVAEAAPKDGQKFGDWVARCGKSKDSECILNQIQTVDGGVRLLEIAFGRIGSKGEFGVSTIVPLGTFLPANILMAVDGKEYTLTLIKCLQNGCMAVAPLDNATIEALRKSKQIVIGLMQEVGRKSVSIAVSPIGLADGLAAIK
ncbi:invasion associated locus B family protein [Paramagnetospirillum marisnigri]|nr:invasion associated locus B family protein [Paramagnetospirillum marisnigri]